MGIKKFKIQLLSLFAVFVLAVAAQHMDSSKEDWYRVIENTVPPKTIDINRKAFDTGYHLTAR